jgi:nicotinate phosphoribosyltransferase
MITSFLDNDLYKFTMQQAVLDHFSYATVEYRFINRCPETRFSEKFFELLQEHIKRFACLRPNKAEINFLKRKCPFLKPWYISYLSSYSYDPSQVVVSNRDGELAISICGPWRDAILWEVPLMATISECYFETDDTGWDHSKQIDKAHDKAKRLIGAGCVWADFGTRRRRSRFVQKELVRIMKLYRLEHAGFVGTSNVLFAYQYDATPIGTMAHEWVMGVGGILGMRRANKFALDKWQETYHGNLGIAITDTYGTPAFFSDFDSVLSRQFDGIRQDSGIPLEFLGRAVEHYKEHRIDPMSKTLVFTDNLNVDRAITIQRACDGIAKCSFGIGTHFTNDFGSISGEESPPLNMVIKLWSINGIPCVKLGDGDGKRQGDSDAVRVANWIFNKKPLDGPNIEIWNAAEYEAAQRGGVPPLPN